MRRLFSTFAHGAPGAGLLLMRVAPGGALLVRGVAPPTAGLAPASVALHTLCAAMGVLLIVGVWTPMVGALAAVDAALRWRRVEIRSATYTRRGASRGL